MLLLRGSRVGFGFDFHSALMESLLTQRESQALQSFLSALDVGDGLTLPSDWPLLSSDFTPEELVSQAEGTEALSKATKDLMALDYISGPKTTRPAVATVEDMSKEKRTILSQHPNPPLHTIRPSNQAPAIDSVVPLHTQLDSSSPPPPQSFLNNKKRPAADSPLSSQPLKRHRPSPNPSQDLPIAAASESASRKPPLALGANSSSVFDPVPLPNKPALLSPSQKKANHIQSEQKRRANIRRGYDALCDRIPELREAIRLEDEALAAAAAVNPPLPRGEHTACAGKGRAKGKRKRGKGATDDGEKLDGRSGPRSENVVLQKSKCRSLVLPLSSM